MSMNELPPVTTELPTGMPGHAETIGRTITETGIVANLLAVSENAHGTDPAITALFQKALSHESEKLNRRIAERLQNLSVNR